MNWAGKVFWKGEQWFVSDEGLELIAPTKDQSYLIEADRSAGGAKNPKEGWPHHMAEKNWIKFDEFLRAYLIACVVHRVELANIGQIVDAGIKIRRVYYPNGPEPAHG